LLTRREGRVALAVRCLAAAGALLALFVMMQPTFKAEFGLIDDHNIVRDLPAHGRLPVTDVPAHVLDRTDEGTGRFRPLYWLGQSLEEAVAGHHPTWWYVDRYLLAGVALLSIFLVAARFIGPLPAAVVALLPFSGPQFETWTRLGPNEAYAFPLAVTGLALIARSFMRGNSTPRSMVAGYALLLASGLAKENFALLAPAAVLVQVLLPQLRRRFRKADWVTAAVVVAVSALTLGATALQIARHGTIYPQHRTTDALGSKLREFYDLGNEFGALRIGLIAGLVCLVLAAVRDRASHHDIRRLVLVVVVVATALVLPQAWVLSGTVSAGRYLYPTVLFLVVLWVAVFWLAAKIGPTPVGMLAVVALVLLLAVPLQRGFHQARTLAKGNAATTQQFQAQLRSIDEVARRAGVNVVVLQPERAEPDYEPAVSVATYLRVQYGLRAMVLAAPSAPTAFAQQLNGDLRYWSEHGGRGFLPYRKRPCLSLVWGLQQPVCSGTLQIF
jgi:hypothetical protein